MTATPTPLRELVADLAKNGLRFDLNPCHDMSDPEPFWHDYVRQMDASIRERAEAALSARDEAGAVGFGVDADSLAAMLGRCLKPEEISADPAKQHDRVHELVRWFARFATGDANAKWAVSHAFELAYYLATTAGNRHIDLGVVREEAFKSGLNVSPSKRAMLERLGIATPSARAYTQADLNAEYTRGRCDGFDAALATPPASGEAGAMACKCAIYGELGIHDFRCPFAAPPADPVGELIEAVSAERLTRRSGTGAEHSSATARVTAALLAVAATRRLAAVAPEDAGDGPDYPDGCDHEGFPGGCARMGHAPESHGFGLDTPEKIAVDCLLCADRFAGDAADHFRSFAYRLRHLRPVAAAAPAGMDAIPVSDLIKQLRPYADPDCRDCDGSGLWMGNSRVCNCLLDALPILQPEPFTPPATAGEE